MLDFTQFTRLIPDVKSIVQYDFAWLAGGAIRSIFYDEIPADYDLFFQNRDNVFETMNFLTDKGYTLTYTCGRGGLYSYERNGTKIQLVCEHVYPSAEGVIESFDIIAGMGILTSDEVIVHPLFFNDVETKTTRLRHIPFPLATLRRIEKYAAKGYRMDRESLLFLSEEINNLSLEDFHRTRLYID